jgi:hypothetical protein
MPWIHQRFHVFHAVLDSIHQIYLSQVHASPVRLEPIRIHLLQPALSAELELFPFQMDRPFAWYVLQESTTWVMEPPLAFNVLMGHKAVSRRALIVILEVIRVYQKECLPVSPVLHLPLLSPNVHGLFKIASAQKVITEHHISILHVHLVKMYKVFLALQTAQFRLSKLDFQEIWAD